MSKYGYSTNNGDILSVTGGTEGTIDITIYDGGDPACIDIPGEDAPAVALAILEAAGLADQDSPKRVPSAIRRLKMHEARRKLDAEREALDDKVRAYLNKVLLNKVGDMYRITDHDRAEYARAAEFFQEPDKKVHNHAFGSAPADPCNACGPRVLNYGDPEPDQDTKWLSATGRPVYFNDWWWWMRNPDGSHYDSARALKQYHQEHFPMTEVKS